MAAHGCEDDHRRLEAQFTLLSDDEDEDAGGLAPRPRHNDATKGGAAKHKFAPQALPKPVQAPLRQPTTQAGDVASNEPAFSRESFSGLELSNRKLSDDALRTELEIRSVRVLRLGVVEAQGFAPGAWATVGVVAQHSVERSSAEKDYDKWVISDLHPESPATVTALIFGAARQDAAPVQVGMVIAVLAPKLLPPKPRARVTICVTKGGSILQIGKAAGLGRCNSVLPGGVCCGQLIHRTRIDKCPVHLEAARAPPPTRRMEFASADPLPPPKRRKQEGLLHRLASRPPAAASQPRNLHAGAQLAMGTGTLRGPGLKYSTGAQRAGYTLNDTTTSVGANAPSGGGVPGGGGGRTCSSGQGDSRPTAGMGTEQHQLPCSSSFASRVAALHPDEPTSRPACSDAKGEARSEFLRRGQSAGTRNVVQMLAASQQQEEEKQRLMRKKDSQQPQQQPASAINQQDQRAQDQRAAPRDGDDDDDDDDGGLSIEFAADTPKYSWQGMLRAPGRQAEQGGTRASSSESMRQISNTNAAIAFFGDAGEEQKAALEHQLRLVANDNMQRAQLSRR